MSDDPNHPPDWRRRLRLSEEALLMVQRIRALHNNVARAQSGGSNSESRNENGTTQIRSIRVISSLPAGNILGMRSVPTVPVVSMPLRRYLPPATAAHNDTSRAPARHESGDSVDIGDGGASSVSLNPSWIVTAAPNREPGLSQETPRPPTRRRDPRQEMPRPPTRRRDPGQATARNPTRDPDPWQGRVLLPISRESESWQEIPRPPTRRRDPGQEMAQPPTIEPGPRQDGSSSIDRRSGAVIGLAVLPSIPSATISNASSSTHNHGYVPVRPMAARPRPQRPSDLELPRAHALTRPGPVEPPAAPPSVSWQGMSQVQVPSSPAARSHNRLQAPPRSSFPEPSGPAVSRQDIPQAEAPSLQLHPGQDRAEDAAPQPRPLAARNAGYVSSLTGIAPMTRPSLTTLPPLPASDPSSSHRPGTRQQLHPVSATDALMVLPEITNGGDLQEVTRQQLQMFQQCVGQRIEELRLLTQDRWVTLAGQLRQMRGLLRRAIIKKAEVSEIVVCMEDYVMGMSMHMHNIQHKELVDLENKLSRLSAEIASLHRRRERSEIRNLQEIDQVDAEIHRVRQQLNEITSTLMVESVQQNTVRMNEVLRLSTQVHEMEGRLEEREEDHAIDNQLQEQRVQSLADQIAFLQESVALLRLNSTPVPSFPNGEPDPSVPSVNLNTPRVVDTQIATPSTSSAQPVPANNTSVLPAATSSAQPVPANNTSVLPAATSTAQPVPASNTSVLPVATSSVQPVPTTNTSVVPDPSTPTTAPPLPRVFGPDAVLSSYTPPTTYVPPTISYPRNTSSSSSSSTCSSPVSPTTPPKMPRVFGPDAVITSYSPIPPACPVLPFSRVIATQESTSACSVDRSGSTSSSTVKPGPSSSGAALQQESPAPTPSTNPGPSNADGQDAAPASVADPRGGGRGPRTMTMEQHSVYWQNMVMLRDTITGMQGELEQMREGVQRATDIIQSLANGIIHLRNQQTMMCDLFSNWRSTIQHVLSELSDIVDSGSESELRHVQRVLANMAQYLFE